MPFFFFLQDEELKITGRATIATISSRLGQTCHVTGTIACYMLLHVHCTCSLKLKTYICAPSFCLFPVVVFYFHLTSLMGVEVQQ